MCVGKFSFSFECLCFQILLYCRSRRKYCWKFYFVCEKSLKYHTKKKISEPKPKSFFLYETKCLFVEVVRERLVFKFATLAVSR